MPEASQEVATRMPDELALLSWNESDLASIASTNCTHCPYMRWFILETHTGSSDCGDRNICPVPLFTTVRHTYGDIGRVNSLLASSKILSIFTIVKESNGVSIPLKSTFPVTETTGLSPVMKWLPITGSGV